MAGIIVMQERASANITAETPLTLPDETRIENDEFERYQFRARQLRTWWQVKRPKYKIDWAFYHKKRGDWD
ncbi:hypothetical protein [Limosilactobacillus caviae]